MNDIDHIETDDDLRMSRSGMSGPGGGCTEATKFLLPIDLDVELRQQAARAGTNVSEYVRDLVCLHLRDLTYGEIVAKSRRALLQPEGQESALNGAGFYRNRGAQV